MTNKLNYIIGYTDKIERAEYVKYLIEKEARRLAYNADTSNNSVNKSYYAEKIKFLPNFWATPKNFEDLISSIDRNLLFIDDIVNICKKFNGGECSIDNKNCSECEKHPFSMLHCLGMMGLIRINPNNNLDEKQIFLHSKQITYIKEKDCLLADKNTMYIIHPALTKSIEQFTESTILHFNGFILGKELTVKQSLLLEIFKYKDSVAKEVFDNKYYNKGIKSEFDT